VNRSVPRRERGAALLAVLLLVAVTGAIAAAAMEKLRLSRGVATNSVALDQARAYANGVEQIAVLIIDDMIVDNPNRTTLAGGWNGGSRRVPLPNDGLAEARLRDGGNCFNINSVVQGDAETTYSRREIGVRQFMGLMSLFAVPEQEARRIAEGAADWADSDNVPGPVGAEDSAYAAGEEPYRTGNTLFADPGELRALAGMTPQVFERIRPWLCTLPVAELSPLNLNTLLPEQAPLLAMLAPGQVSIERARAVLASRPANGWGNQIAFWQQESMSEVSVPLEVQLQPQLATRWFAIDTRVRMLDSEFSEEVLVDARLQPLRIVSRRWGE
jgi:general secretion pathway protein K